MIYLYDLLDQVENTSLDGNQKNSSSKLELFFLYARELHSYGYRMMLYTRVRWEPSGNKARRLRGLRNRVRAFLNPECN